MSIVSDEDVAARRLFSRAGGGRVIATVYVPVAVSEDEWSCMFDILGLPDPVRSEGRGVDSLQALTVAIGGMRLLLSRSGESLTWDEQESGDYGIPRYIPRGFGLEIEAHLVAAVEKELALLVAARSREPE